jgi:hypothetical protein
MHIRHTITFLDDDLPARRAAVLRKQLQWLRLIRTDASMLNFVIYHDDPAWAAVADLLRDYRAIDLAWSEFSASELDAADWLHLRASGQHHGYPMPDGDHGLKSIWLLFW